LADVTGECSATAVAPTTTDACAGTITGTTTDPLTYNTSGTYSITWNFDDGNGQSIDVTQNVIIEDAIPPTAACKDITLNLNASGKATLTPEMINNGSNDNCTPDNELAFSLDISSFDCSNLGDNIVTLRVSDAAGNISTCTATIYIPSSEFELGDDTYVCEGEPFSITLENSYSSIQWSDGSSGQTFTTTEEGLISCLIIDEFGCDVEDDIYLEVKPLPYVNLGRDTTLCGEQVLNLNAGPDAIMYDWSTGESSEEIVVYQGSQKIWVNVEDEYGCLNSDTISIDKCDPSIFFLDISNALTPSNQDGRNDVWEIEEILAYPDAVVDIYDRWGRLIWRSEAGYPTPWDGRNMRGNEVPMDSYHYIIILNYEDNDRVIGTVTVIR